MIRPLQPNAVQGPISYNNTMDPDALIYGVIAAKVRTAPGEKGTYTPYHVSVVPGAEKAVIITFINSDGSMEETRKFVLPTARRVSMKTSGKSDYIVAVEVASIRIKLKLSSRDSQLKWVRVLEPPRPSSIGDRTYAHMACLPSTAAHNTNADPVYGNLASVGMPHRDSPSSVSSAHHQATGGSLHPPDFHSPSSSSSFGRSVSAPQPRSLPTPVSSAASPKDPILTSLDDVFFGMTDDPALNRSHHKTDHYEEAHDREEDPSDHTYAELTGLSGTIRPHDHVEAPALGGIARSTLPSTNQSPPSKPRESDTSSELMSSNELLAASPPARDFPPPIPARRIVSSPPVAIPSPLKRGSSETTQSHAGSLDLSGGRGSFDDVLNRSRDSSKGDAYPIPTTTHASSVKPNRVVKLFPTSSSAQRPPSSRPLGASTPVRSESIKEEERGAHPMAGHPLNRSLDPSLFGRTCSTASPIPQLSPGSRRRASSLIEALSGDRDMHSNV